MIAVIQNNYDYQLWLLESASNPRLVIFFRPALFENTHNDDHLYEPTCSMTGPSSASGPRQESEPDRPNGAGGLGLGQEPRANTAVELLVSLLHSSSHPHQRRQQQQQRAKTGSNTTTKSVDTDDADVGDIDEMSVLQRKVLYALSSALRGNVDVQVCIQYPSPSSIFVFHERTSPYHLSPIIMLSTPSMPWAGGSTDSQTNQQQHQ